MEINQFLSELNTNLEKLNFIDNVKIEKNNLLLILKLK